MCPIVALGSFRDQSRLALGGERVSFQQGDGFLPRKGKRSFHGYVFGIVAALTNLLIIALCARMTSPLENKIIGLCELSLMTTSLSLSLSFRTVGV